MSESELHTYFKRLKEAFSLPEEMQLKHIPDDGCIYEGYVSEERDTVYIFNEDLEEAKKTLQHEIADLLVTTLASNLASKRRGNGNQDPELKQIELELYHAKEAVVDKLIDINNVIEGNYGGSETISREKLAESMAIFTEWMDGELKVE